MTRPTGQAARQWQPWPELGIWNLYFLLKLGLYFTGYLNLQLFPNLVFIAALLIPLPWRSLRIARQLVAVPVGVALLYQDTWLPPFSRLLSQPGVLDFTFDYFLEIVDRTINWPMLGMFFVASIVYLYIHVWVRLSFVTLALFCWLGLQQGALLPAGSPSVAPAMPVSLEPLATAEAQEPQDLNAVLNGFLEEEKTRHVAMGERKQSTPVDIVFLSICSLSWDDLVSTGLVNHPLFDQFDLVFERFNSATSYSGPAVRRLMRASCGQSSHDSLHRPAPAQCSLMNQLAGQGLDVEVLLNHTGEFDGFANMIRAESSRLHMSGLPQGKSLQRAFVGFDGTPIWRDREVLSGWWQQRLATDRQPQALLYNSITLHDGNRVALLGGNSRRADYHELAAGLLDDMTGVVQMMERAGRPVILVLIPEHGASLAGDRMQIAGMREIPSPAITHVPVAVKLLGFEREGVQEQLRLSGQSSYLALAELLKRLLEQDPDQPLDLARLSDHLPETRWVSENDQTVVLQHNGQSHIRLRDDGDWLPYPEVR